MATRRDLLTAVKAYEVKLRDGAQEAPHLKERVVTKLKRHHAGPVLDFTVSLEEVGGKPKFVTTRFASPKPASFIFFSYDPTGKRFFNKKIFDRMADFLEEGHLISEFIGLLEQQSVE